MTAHIQQYVTPRHYRQSRAGRLAGQAGLPAGQAGRINRQAVAVGFSLLVLFSLTMLGFFYLQQVLETASRGSEISELENRLMGLKMQQRSLELESAELRSIQNIEGQLNTLNLVATDHVAYLSLPEGRVAYSPAN